MKTSFLTLQYTILITLFLAFACADVQAGPDIRISLDDPEKWDYYPNENITVHCHIKNIGDEDAYDFEAEFFVSPDSTITADDYSLCTSGGAGSHLPAGAGSPYRFLSGEIESGDLPPGEYYLGAIVTCPGDTNLENNIVCISTPISFDGSDLIVESIELSDFSHSVPDEVWIDYRIRNNGAKDSRAYVVRFYASLDTTITTNDYLLEGVTHSGMPAGEAGSGDYRLQFVRMPRGDYYVGIIIVCRSEIDATNNSGCSSETLSIIPYPDIIVRDMDEMSGTYIPGDSIEVDNVVLENIGYGPAESYTIDYYASTMALGE